MRIQWFMVCGVWCVIDSWAGEGLGCFVKFIHSLMGAFCGFVGEGRVFREIYPFKKDGAGCFVTFIHSVRRKFVHFSGVGASSLWFSIGWGVWVLSVPCSLSLSL